MVSGFSTGVVGSVASGTLLVLHKHSAQTRHNSSLQYMSTPLEEQPIPDLDILTPGDYQSSYIGHPLHSICAILDLQSLFRSSNGAVPAITIL